MPTDLTLFVMSQKGYACLRAIGEAYPGLIRQVVGAQDRAVQKDYYDEIRDYCAHRKIAFCDRREQPRLESPYAFAASWRWMIDLGQSRLIAYHDSLLPRYRGFNPLVSALINGDAEVGVTAVLATGQYDRGDIVGQWATPIRYPITIQCAIDQICDVYAQLSQSIAQTIASGKAPTGEPQDESKATYSLWRDDRDYRIDWNRDAATIRRMIDAVGYPYLGAQTICDGKQTRVLSAQELPDLSIENRAAGKVIFIDQEKPVVVCGTGLLRIDELMDDETGTSLLPLARLRVRFE